MNKIVELLIGESGVPVSKAQLTRYLFKADPVYSHTEDEAEFDDLRYDIMSLVGSVGSNYYCGVDRATGQVVISMESEYDPDFPDGYFSLKLHYRIDKDTGLLINPPHVKGTGHLPIDINSIADDLNEIISRAQELNEIIIKAKNP